MWSILLSIIIGLLLIIHGVAHWTLPTGWDTSSSENPWLLGSLGLSASAIHTIGMVLSIVTLLVFMAAGVALFAHLSLWKVLAVSASIISLVMILLFWRFDMVFGALIDIGVIAALLMANWSSKELLGS
ncbi:MAG TPA: hypothetical protein VNG51_17155 [Ktedonobacteraceae bacterium]|nr:hypothetical protein [Ktedonobacteraceae bacterium]